ncbi:MAG: hypothetical protein HYR84_11975, partial [Planctomycetes bacterium]|nr:hypothetical protein [Planctomycetota bacterium]
MRKSAIFACLVAFLVLAWPVVAWEVSTNDLLDAKAKSVFPRLERIADEGAAGMKSPRRGRTP